MQGCLFTVNVLGVFALMKGLERRVECVIQNSTASAGILHLFSMNWWSIHDFPDPALPITKNLKRKSEEEGKIN